MINIRRNGKFLFSDTFLLAENNLGAYVRESGIGAFTSRKGTNLFVNMLLGVLGVQELGTAVFKSEDIIHVQGY